MRSMSPLQIKMIKPHLPSAQLFIILLNEIWAGEGLRMRHNYVTWLASGQTQPPSAW